MNRSDSVFGRSLSFPLQVGVDGRLVWSQGENNIRESMIVILKTEPGERIALPDFGAGLARFLFEPNNAATHALIEQGITAALSSWERRIELESVEVVPDSSQLNAALASIQYRLVATGTRERISVSIPLSTS